MRTYTLTIPAGVTDQIVGIEDSDFLFVHEASADPWRLGLNKPDYIKGAAGMTVRPVGSFNQLYIANDSGTTLQLKITTGRGSVVYGPSQVNVAGAVDAVVQPNNQLLTLPDVAPNPGVLTLLAAAHPDRRALILADANGSNWGSPIRIGNINTDANTGLAFNGNPPLTLWTSDAVYAFKPSGGTFVISLTEIRSV